LCVTRPLGFVHMSTYPALFPTCVATSDGLAWCSRMTAAVSRGRNRFPACRSWTGTFASKISCVRASAVRRLENSIQRHPDTPSESVEVLTHIFCLLSCIFQSVVRMTCARVESSSGRITLANMPLRPVTQVPERQEKAAPHLCEAVLNAGRNRGVNLAVDQTVPYHRA